MYNILINKTDPYSFMGLIKSTRAGRATPSSINGLINAGVVSIFLIFAISRMAHGAMVEDRETLPQKTTETVQNSTCHYEACNMV